MTTNRYYGSLSNSVASFSVDINSSTITVGAVTEVSIVGEADHTEFFDPENVTRSDVKRSEVSVTVDVTFREFDEEFAQYWLEGTGSSTGTTINNTSDVAEFTSVTLQQVMTDHTNSSGDASLKAVVDNVHFPEMPLLEFSQGEYNEQQVTGHGDGVTLTLETVP